MHQKPHYVYIAFDVFPSQKGAATHINHCLNALQNTYPAGMLICLGNDEMPSFQFDAERNLYVYRFKEKIQNFLGRTQSFQETVSRLLQLPIASQVSLVHFRDVWSALGTQSVPGSFKTVYEVNALAHLELPNRYPSASAVVLQKIKQLEQQCIHHCNSIITPSEVTKQFLIKNFNTPSAKITVIPNGVTLYPTTPLLKTKTTPYILYFGAFQKWQGIKTLFKGFKELKDLDLRLVLCASVPKKRVQIYHTLAKDLGIFDRIDWYYELDKTRLAKLIKGAFLSVAPLASCDRNIIQGCNPLKVLESMSYATPVVASKLPVTESLIQDEETGFLVPADRPQLLGRKIRSLYQEKQQVKKVGQNARKLIQEKYLWKDQEIKMKQLYQMLTDV